MEVQVIENIHTKSKGEWLTLHTNMHTAMSSSIFQINFQSVGKIIFSDCGCSSVGYVNLPEGISDMR